MNAGWLGWARRLQAIAQEGLTYTRDRYDVQRYERLRGIAAEILGAHSTAGVHGARELLALEAGPATPKVDVRAAAFSDGKILLIREPDDGAWSPPGGWADVGETPAEAAVREVYEESGHRVRAQRLICAYDRDRRGHYPPIPYHVYKLVFLCEMLDEPPSAEAESVGVGFFGEDELPELSLSRVTPAQIGRFFEHHRDPTLPTDFD